MFAHLGWCLWCEGEGLSHCAAIGIELGSIHYSIFQFPFFESDLRNALILTAEVEVVLQLKTPNSWNCGGYHGIPLILYFPYPCFATKTICEI